MASVQNLVRKRKYAKVRSSDGLQRTEAWNNYKYSQSNRKVLANQGTLELGQEAELLLGTPQRDLGSL